MRRRISKPATFNTALRRLGLATPTPFVGRARELELLAGALHDAVVLVVHGAVGSGKTRLAKQLSASPEITSLLAPAYVRCAPGDVAAALRARAERALDALPGALEQTLRDEPRLLIIDDAHNLAQDEAARLLAELTREVGAGRLLLLSREVLPLRRNDSQRFEMTLEGLDEGAARELWAQLEETYGPTQAGACDDALTRTRGMPLAMRREYARYTAGDGAWELSELSEDARAALEAIAVLAIPVAPAAVEALAPEIRVEAALIELVSRQLIDPRDDGRFEIHDVVRGDVLNGTDPARRSDLERTAAELVSAVGGGQPDGRRLAWESGDDGALGLLSPIERLREAVRHLVAAGDADAAVARLIQDRDAVIDRGGGGEVLGLVGLIAADASVAPARRRLLDTVRAEIAARHGRVAEALEAGGPRDPVEAAWLVYRSGDVASACATLAVLHDSADDPDQRCRASALLAEIELARGDRERARSLLAAAFERDRSGLGDVARARLHMAHAAVDERSGHVTSARAALARASSASVLPPLVLAQIEARRAMCLAHEGRGSEAQRALAAAEKVAREVDAIAISDELLRCRALILARTGDTGAASDMLRDVVERRRQRGDEIGALTAEIDLSRIWVRRGELAAAAELSAACTAAAIRRGLRGLAAEARSISAACDVAVLRVADARTQLDLLAADPATDDVVRHELSLLRALVDAWTGHAGPSSPTDDGRDDIDQGRLAAELALAGGDASAALDAARGVAFRAERGGRPADMADALALVARLQLARGDKPAAMASASRAAREALSCGLTRARVNALLVLAALARDEGDVSAAATYAQDAALLASEAGLSLERLVASQAMEVIADGDQARASQQAQSAAAATMSDIALDAASRMLCDLGLTAARPYRVVGASGQESFVADASPDILRLEERDLAVDGVREVIVRRGQQIADLRRRSLLKRLLFLFAASPGKTFSKEEIVQSVWNVDYHPLRHDAALFTNIMRIRRLLGGDGADLIRVSEDGYKFCPGKDFVFVSPASGE